MGGKRPDQHNIDPREAGATDYKTRNDDEHLVEEAKQAVQADSRSEQPTIPKRGVNPALRELQNRKRAPDAGEGDE